MVKRGEERKDETSEMSLAKERGGEVKGGEMHLCEERRGKERAQPTSLPHPGNTQILAATHSRWTTDPLISRLTFSVK